MGAIFIQITKQNINKYRKPFKPSINKGNTELMLYLTTK